MSKLAIFSSPKFTVSHHKYQTPELSTVYEPVKYVATLGRPTIMSGTNHIITYDQLLQGNIYYNGANKYDVAIYDMHLYKVYHTTKNNKKCYIIDISNGKYNFCDQSTRHDNIIDLIKWYTNNPHVNPADIIYLVVIYDRSWPSYKINRNAYCDLLVLIMH